MRASSVSVWEVGDCFSCLPRASKVGLSWWSGGPKGRPDLSPALPLCQAFSLDCCLPARWERGVVVACGDEDAPVGKGPRRTRPHPGARTKYTAPEKIQERGGGRVPLYEQMLWN